MWHWSLLFCYSGLSYFYSHIPCGMWRMIQVNYWMLFMISTHTSRVGCDCYPESLYSDCSISTHTSRVGCDDVPQCIGMCSIDFYSHIIIRLKTGIKLISTHTSRVGCDKILSLNLGVHSLFLLTHPVWDVTYKRRTWWTLRIISTHTSRVGCDRYFRKWFQWNTSFLLTHPVWDVTLLADIKTNTTKYFYSHIPCGMWLIGNFSYNKTAGYFYSHIPCGMWL